VRDGNDRWEMARPLFSYSLVTLDSVGIASVDERVVVAAAGVARMRLLACLQLPRGAAAGSIKSQKARLPSPELACRVHWRGSWGFVHGAAQIGRERGR